MKNTNIKKYIIEGLKNGFSKEKIKKKILDAGYDEGYINKIFDDAEKPKKKWFKRTKVKEEKVKAEKKSKKKWFKRTKVKEEKVKAEKKSKKKWFKFKKIKVKVEEKPVVEPLAEEIHNIPEQKIIINKDDIKDNPHPVSVITDEKKGLKSTMEDINSKLSVLTQRDTKKEQKEFKMPSKLKNQLKKLALKNKILIILLTRNRGMIPMVTEIKDGFVNIGGTPHQCAVDQVFLWKGKYPAMVVPEWDIRPIGTQDYYDAVRNKTIADPIAIAIRMIENKENIMKNKMSNKAWIFIGLGVIAFLYVIFGGGN